MDWLNPNPLRVAVRFFFKTLPYRRWWTPGGLFHLFVDAVWH